MIPEQNSGVITADTQVAALQSILAAHGRPATDVIAGADAGREPTTGTSPQTTEGPYSIAVGTEGRQRVDITDGRPGVPLQLRITVLSAGQGLPIQGAERRNTSRPLFIAPNLCG